MSMEMKEMNKKKRLSIVLAVILLLLLAGCQASESVVGNPPVPMKAVTQNSKEDLATFAFQLPEDWASAPQNLLTVIGCPESAAQKNFKTQEDELPFKVGVSNYYYPGLALSEKDKEIYKNLFAGKTSAYEEHIKQSFANAAGMLSAESSSTVRSPKVDFKYQHYNGTHGKITEVQYSYVYNDKETHIIQCYREDIPYLVTGAFDDSVDLSSGKIALWVADSLKVTEHFTIKDNIIQRNLT